MTQAKRSEWLVLLGAGLLVLGGWLLLERIFGWLFVPLAKVLGFIGHLGWPLVLVGIGVLLIMNANNNGVSDAAKRLVRSRTDRKVGGVLGGFAETYGLDSSLVRIIYALATLLTGLWAGFLLYAVAMVVIPEQPFAAGVGRPVPPAPEVPTAPTAPDAC